MSLQKQDYGTATKMEESETKLRFQWSDHGGELGKLSRSLFGSDDLSDVTLTCRGGKAYHAHRFKSCHLATLTSGTSSRW